MGIVCEPLWFRRDHHSCIWEVVEVASSSELASSDCRCCGTEWGTCGSIKFLQELVRIGDLAGSIIVQILHCGEGGDVDHVAQTSKQIYVLAIAFSLSLNSTYSFISCMRLLFLSILACYILCYIDILAGDYWIALYCVVLLVSLVLIPHCLPLFITITYSLFLGDFTGVLSGLTSRIETVGCFALIFSSVLTIIFY